MAFRRFLIGGLPQGPEHGWRQILRYNQQVLEVGSHDSYDWLVTDQAFDLLRICPDVVLGKYIAITSFDSGPLVLTDEEKGAGWQSRSEIAYSPKISGSEAVPRDQYDEWYIFETPADLGVSHIRENIFEAPQGKGHVNVVVNYNFAPHPPERATLAGLFWPQISWIHPESYVADNDYLTFATLNQVLFAKVLDTVKAIVSSR